jgi:hypothetical protein
MSKLTDDIREWASQPWIGPVLEEAMQAWAREVAELERRVAALEADPPDRPDEPGA